MPNKKTIEMFCWGPIVLGYSSPWEDVWIKYHVGKGKVVKEGPLIAGLCELRSELCLNEEVGKKHPSKWRDQRIEELRRIQEELKAGAMFVSEGGLKDGLPNIYVNSEMIDKGMAEKAVAWWLKKKGVLRSEPKFRWNKLKGKMCIQPISPMGD